MKLAIFNSLKRSEFDEDMKNGFLHSNYVEVTNDDVSEQDLLEITLTCETKDVKHSVERAEKEEWDQVSMEFNISKKDAFVLGEFLIMLSRK